jgi:NHL repeat-containing protein
MPSGVMTTLAGLAGSPGTNDGMGCAAQFREPFGVTVDSGGNVYVADSYNYTIRKVTPAGMVTTLAGLAGNRGSADETGSAARFGNPRGVAVDSAGNVYVADSGNDTIRKVTVAGVVTTLAGLAGSTGTNDGTGNAARFQNPWGIAVDSATNVYVADYRNCTIRRVTPAGVVTTLGGLAASSGSLDGTGSFARFYDPQGVVVDSAGNVYVADTGNSTIRKGFPRIQVGIGSTVVQVGQDGALPVTLLSSVGITNLSFTLASSGNRLTNWTITSTNPSVETTTVLTVGSSQPSFNLGIQAGQTFQSPTLLGTIGFTALPGDSAFVPVAATNIIGINSDFGQMTNITSLSGQVVAVGLHPLLAASLDTNSTRILNIYGNPGSNYQVAFSTNLASPNWQPAGSVLMTNLQQNFNVNQAVPQVYYHIQ